MKVKPNYNSSFVYADACAIGYATIFDASRYVGLCDV